MGFAKMAVLQSLIANKYIVAWKHEYSKNAVHDMASTISDNK